VYRRNMAVWYTYLAAKVQKNAAAGIFPARRNAEQDRTHIALTALRSSVGSTP
jgi:hypothetical protein